MSKLQEEKMQACRWCNTTITRRWEKAANDPTVILCHACSRTKKNGYVSCAMCRTRRLCKKVDNLQMCSICVKIDWAHKTKLPISCVKCETTKSMSWHTIASGENVCLYCYDDNDIQLAPSKKKTKYTHKSQYRVQDDVEMAAIMLCHMIVTAK